VLPVIGESREAWKFNRCFLNSTRQCRPSDNGSSHFTLRQQWATIFKNFLIFSISIIYSIFEMKTKYIVCLNIRKIELNDDQVDELDNMDYTKNGEYILDVCDTNKMAVESLAKAVDAFDACDIEYL
jgi:cbb3-type cytochrome oxidase subunit 3